MISKEPWHVDYAGPHDGASACYSRRGSSTVMDEGVDRSLWAVLIASALPVSIEGWGMASFISTNGSELYNY